MFVIFFFFSSRRRHTRSTRDWSSDVCSSDLWAKQPERLQGVKWRQGCFAQGAVVDWWFCLGVKVKGETTIAPKEAVGIDLGLKEVAVTSDGARCERGGFYRDIEPRIAQAQRRGHKRQAKRLHRRAAN